MRKLAILLIVVSLLAVPIAYAACQGFYENVTHRYWVQGYNVWVDTSHYETYVGGISRGGIAQYSTRWVQSGYWEWVNGYWQYSYTTIWRHSPVCRSCH